MQKISIISKQYYFVSLNFFKERLPRSFAVRNIMEQINDFYNSATNFIEKFCK